mgnify:FL=1
MEDMEILTERWELARGRIEEICEELKNERVDLGKFSAYFLMEAEWFAHLFKTADRVNGEDFEKLDEADLTALNEKHYGELLGERYDTSYANPAFAVERLGEEYGRLFSALHVHYRRGIGFVYDEKKELFLALAELFLEIYSAFVCEKEENGGVPAYEEIRKIYYWHRSDYADVLSLEQVGNQVVPKQDMAKRLLMEADLTDLRYLYRYGEYISDSELKTAAFLNSLPEETIATMADTFTEGYRIGFITTNKDISKKKSVCIYYNIGFERVVRRAISNFKKIGLDSIVYRGRYQSTAPNRQYSYDHKDDDMLFFDRQYMNRKLETLKTAFEQYKKEAALFGGPAVIEVFGEEPFSPVPKKEAVQGDEQYQHLNVEYISAYRRMMSNYVKEEERSFTIIAFPTPDIGDNFTQIFDEIIRINTLDYSLYQKIQQTMIDTLDRAEYVEVKGMNGNRTDVKVMLCALNDPEKESKFENCVADVNIPVGEVFTSPRLKGTNGVLHVSRVFLNGLEYWDFEIDFKDGMVADYHCGNFPDAEEGRRYIKDNVLMHHDTLPLGEFAVGTNTTAYMVAEKYGIGGKLPILIAEKMGPHFAVGDTCYSQAEDVKVYNPDGKEIIARENEVSALRKTDMQKAYFNCHTDITIPYHELGLLAAVKKDGSRVPIIENGRFVLPGCEELNKPFN